MPNDSSKTRRISDPSVSDLPFIDEHVQIVDAPTDALWAALLRVLARQPHASARLARVLAANPARGTTEFTGSPGQTIPGFLIAEASHGRHLALSGRHRFATYRLTFLIDGPKLRAQTFAEFPGLLGRIYRGLVITSGAHRLITRHLLRTVARVARHTPALLA